MSEVRLLSSGFWLLFSQSSFQIRDQLFLFIRPRVLVSPAGHDGLRQVEYQFCARTFLRFQHQHEALVAVPERLIETQLKIRRGLGDEVFDAELAISLTAFSVSGGMAAMLRTISSFALRSFSDRLAA